MQAWQIQFTAPGVAELNAVEIPAVTGRNVLVKTSYTVVSGGTERANLMGMPNTDPNVLDMEGMKFPKVLGYCGVGIVEQIGPEVRSVKPGDRVIIYFGSHTSYNLVPEEKVIRIDDCRLKLHDLAPAVIAQIAMSGVRMSRLELGESAMVMGLGILGMYAVQWLKLMGACPILAVDPQESRRKKALTLGADFALDPTGVDFPRQVHNLTHGGANVGIEVSGAAIALEQILECTAPMARVVLLGCTRINDRCIDFYHKVHARGVVLLGAHTSVRPILDSRPGYWTYRDELEALLRMISLGRINLSLNIEEIHSALETPDVYARLAANRDFPTGMILDWRDVP